MKAILYIIIFSLTVSLAWGQEPVIVDNTDILVYPSASSGSIKLRWATNIPLTWQTGTLNGYYIKREKFDANGTVVATEWLNGGNAIMPLAKLINPALTPDPNIESNSPWNQFFVFPIVNGKETVQFPNHVTMFGAIYGEVGVLQDANSTITAGTTVKPSSEYTEDEKLKQRHFNALLAAEMSFEAAKLGGLGYEDTNIEANIKYKYYIFAATQPNVPPTNILGTSCGSLTISSIIPPSQNKTDVCKEVILDEGFEADPNSTFEYIVETSVTDNSTVSTISPPTTGITTTALAFAVVDYNSTPTEPPLGITAEFRADNTNVLKWELPKNTIWRKFDIYRKDDIKINWEKINKTPIYSLLDNHEKDGKNLLYYTDQTAELKEVIPATIPISYSVSKDIFKKYNYKIIGYNIFDEASAFSNTTTDGRAFDAFVIYPRISEHQLSDLTATNEVNVKMKFEFYSGADVVPDNIITNTLNPIISKIELEKSNTGDLNDFTFEKIIPAVFWTVFDYPVPSTQTNAIYYRLKVTYTGTRLPNYSNPIMVQLVDDTPPSIPTDISIVSTYPKIENGKVKIRLRWTKNTEPDFLGYRIFRKNFDNETAMNVTSKFTEKDPISNENKTDILFNPSTAVGITILDDELSTESLNTKIYYQIMTVDKRFNQSALSAAIQVARPNLVPPILPIFSVKPNTDPAKPANIFSIVAGKPAATIRWSVSIDEDIEQYELFKFESKNISFVGKTAIATYTPTTFMNISGDDTFLEFTDANIDLGKTYIYVVRLKDKYLPNEEFISEKPMVVEVPVVMENIALPTLATFIQTNRKDPNWIELKWTIANATDVLEYEIYRGEFKGDFVPANAQDKIKVSSWKVLSSDYTSIKDKNIIIGNSYRYMIRARFKNGTFTDWKYIDEVNY